MPQPPADLFAEPPPPDLFTDKPVDKPTNQAPADTSFLDSVSKHIPQPVKSTADWATTPLLDVPKYTKRYTDYLSTPELSDEKYPFMPYVKGFMGGAGEGLSKVASSFTTPLNIATMGSLKGASVLSKSAPTIARGLRYAGGALSSGIAGHGMYGMATAPTWQDKLMAAAETAGGMLGLDAATGAFRPAAKAGMSPNGVQPESAASVNDTIIKARQRADQIIKSGAEPLLKPEEIPAARARLNELLDKGRQQPFALTPEDIAEGKKLDAKLREVNFGEDGLPGSKDTVVQKPPDPQYPGNARFSVEPEQPGITPNEGVQPPPPVIDPEAQSQRDGTGPVLTGEVVNEGAPPIRQKTGNFFIDDAARMEDEALSRRADPVRAAEDKAKNSEWNSRAREVNINEGRFNEPNSPPLPDEQLTPEQMAIRKSYQNIKERQDAHSQWFSEQEEKLPDGEFFKPSKEVTAAYDAEQELLKNEHQKLVDDYMAKNGPVSGDKWSQGPVQHAQPNASPEFDPSTLQLESKAPPKGKSKGNRAKQIFNEKGVRQPAQEHPGFGGIVSDESVANDDADVMAAFKAGAMNNKEVIGHAASNAGGESTKRQASEFGTPGENIPTSRIPEGGTPGGVFGNNAQPEQQFSRMGEEPGGTIPPSKIPPGGTPPTGGEPQQPFVPFNGKPPLRPPPEIPPNATPEVKQGLVRRILNTNKAILTSWDLSAPGRQGKSFILNKTWWTSLDDMAKAWGSKEAAHMIDQSIVEHPSGYFRPGPEGKSFADKVGLDIAPHEEAFNTGPVGKIVNKLGLIERSSRAHTAFLNKLRSDQFVAFMDAAKENGMNPETNLVQAKAFANFINDATGRGSLNFGKWKLERNINVLNDVFFAPKNMAGQIRMWNRVLNPYEYYKADPVLRKQALKSLFAIAGAGSAVSELASLLPGVEVNHDPTSADFMKIKVGDTRLDNFGGYQQFPVAAMKFLSGQSTSTSDKNYGRATDLDAGKFGQQTRGSVAERYFTNRLSPAGSFVWSWMFNREFDGMPFETKKALYERTAPIAMKDIYDMAQTDPVLAAVMAVPTTMGLSNTQTYTGR